MSHPVSRAALLGRVVASLRDPEDATRQALEAASVVEAGISAPMATYVWDLALARYTPEAVAALAQDAREPGRTVGVIVGRSVAVAPWRAMVLPWLAGAAVRVRPSRSMARITRCLVDRLQEAGAAVSMWEGEVSAGMTEVVAYGRDETLATLADALPPGVGFVGYGHGFGMALVGPGGVDDPRVAEALALDVALHDQSGCLSPQGVIVVGDPVGFGRRLGAALDALAARLPRGVDDVGRAAAAMQWAGVEAALGADLWRTAGGVVSARPEGPLRGSPGGRVVLVRGVGDVSEATALLAPHAQHLSCVAVTSGVAGWEPAGYRGRTVSPGAMQDPPLDGPEDRRGPRVKPRPVRDP